MRGELIRERTAYKRGELIREEGLYERGAYQREDLIKRGAN